jgi:hypothetical protein
VDDNRFPEAWQVRGEGSAGGSCLQDTTESAFYYRLHSPVILIEVIEVKEATVKEQEMKNADSFDG